MGNLFSEFQVSWRYRGNNTHLSL